MGSQRTVVVVANGGDDPHEIATWLQEDGWTAACAEDFAGGFRQLYNYHPDAVVLLTSANDSECWLAIQRIRELCATPIVLIGPRPNKGALERAFSLGLDRYLEKPVEPARLVKLLSSLMLDDSGTPAGPMEGRETYYDSTARPPRDNGRSPQVFQHEQIVVDWRKMEVRLDGGLVHLSPTEFRLLAFLIERRGWVVSYDEILTRVWGPGYIGDRNNVKLYVWYLRRKLERDPSSPRWIRTKYGVGYTFAVDDYTEEQPLSDRQLIA